MKLFIFLIISCFSAFFVSCEDEFEVNAPWKDITVVYGFLDPSDTVQYVRINKMFLGEADVYSMAQVFDSSNYQGKLKVELYENNSSNSNSGKLIAVLDTITIFNKESGTFSSPLQKLYYFKNTGSSILDTEREYKIVITKPNGEKVTGTTPLVHAVTISSPAYWDTLNPPPSFPPSQKYPTVSFKTLSGDFNSSKIEWTYPDNAYLFEVMLRFYYVETNNGISLEKTVDFNLGTTKVGYDRIKEISGEAFYSRLAKMIETNPNIRRRAGQLNNPNNQVEVLISAAAEDLGIYIEVHKPTSSIVQERPEYTNLSNGLGVFSSRATKRQFYKLAPNSELELITGSYTKNLNFF